MDELPITANSRIDDFWAKVCAMKTSHGDEKFGALKKVVKSILCIPNGNASVERSLSDNRNTLTPERTALTEESLIGLRRIKEYARSCGGADCVDTSTPEIVQSVQKAHSKYKERKRQEQEERKIKMRKLQKDKEHEKKREALINKTEKKKTSIDKMEENLTSEEKEIDANITVAQRLLSDATESLSVAAKKGDMIGVKAATNMLEIAKNNLEKLNEERREKAKMRARIGQKRKLTLDTFVTKIKKTA